MRLLLLLVAVPAAADPTPVPTCGPGWRSQGSMLSHLDADDTGATVCAQTMSSTGTTASSCVRVDFATGKFSDGTPAATPAPVTPKLDIPAKDAEALADSALSIDLRADGARALVPLPIENKVVEFDAATGKRIAEHVVTSKAAPCVSEAFYIGEAIYASSRKCDALEHEATRAQILVAGKSTAIAPMLFASKVSLGGGKWAVASQDPLRVAIFDGRATPAWTTQLPSIAHDRKLTPDKRFPCCYALGLDPFGTLFASSSYVAKAGDNVVVVSPRGVALVDPKKKTTKLFRFRKCS